MVNFLKKRWHAYHPNVYLLFFLLISVGSGLFIYAEPMPGVADTMGYLYAGRQLAQGQGPVFTDELNDRVAPYFSPYAFQIRITPDSRMFLGFPPGLASLVAAGVLLAGSETAAHYVVPFLSIGFLWAAFLLTRELTGRSLAGLLTAAGLAGTAVFWEFGTAAWSEIPSAFFILLGLYGYLRGERTPDRRTAHMWYGLAALLLVFSWFIRYANITIIPALVLYELSRYRWQRIKSPPMWLFTIILLLGLGGLLLFNTYYYGGPTLTSYSPENGWYPYPAFSWSYALGPSFVGGYSTLAVLEMLWSNLHLFLILIPFGFSCFTRSKQVLLGSAIFFSLGPYTIYAFQADGINSRFILTALPFLTILAAAGALKGYAWLSPPAVKLTWALLLLLLLVRPLPGIWQDLAARNESQVTGMADILSFVDWSEPNAVFMSYTMNDHIAYFAGRSVLNYRRILRSDGDRQAYRWDQYRPCLAWTVFRVQNQERPIYFIKDGDPPWGDTLNQLEIHFDLTQIHENPPIYQVGELRHDLNDVFSDDDLAGCAERLN